jgi:hypothetical protein
VSGSSSDFSAPGIATVSIRLPRDGGAEPYLQQWNPNDQAWIAFAVADGERTWPLRHSQGDRYEWRELTAGRYRWIDSWSGISAEPFDIDADRATAESALDLSSVAIVRGTVLLPEGCPGIGIAVERLGGPDGMRSSPTCPPEFGRGLRDLDGAFAVRVPGSAPVRLRAWGRPVDGNAPRSEVEVLGARDGIALTATIDAARAWVERVVHEVPAIESRFLAHLEHNNLELLPHLFFGDLTRFVVSGFSDEPERRGDAEKILVLLEEAMGSPDEAVQNLVSVSFCENLLGEKPLDAIRASMGPRLRAELAMYEQR